MVLRKGSREAGCCDTMSTTISLGHPSVSLDFFIRRNLDRLLFDPFPIGSNEHESLKRPTS